MNRDEFAKGIEVVEIAKRDKLEDGFVDMLWDEFSHIEACDWLDGCRRVIAVRTYGKVEKADFMSATQTARITRFDEEEKLLKATQRTEAFRQREEEFHRRAKEGGFDSVEDYLDACKEEGERERRELHNNGVSEKLLKKRLADAKEMGEDTAQRPDESDNQWLERILEAARRKHSIERRGEEMARDQVAQETFKRADARVKLEEDARRARGH